MYTSHHHHIAGTSKDYAPAYPPNPCGGLTNCPVCVKEALQADGYKKRADVIEELVQKGVLGTEELPAPDFWRWPVLKPELLPDEFQSSYKEYGEYRWYGS